jgi:flavin reductase (DIM6/NTAB) family NADH-FMN oxidoreductase RutF
MNAKSTIDIDTDHTIDSNAFRRALRVIAGSVSIVTSGRAPKRHGLTVTAACSLSIDPSTALVCVNQSAGAHDTILRTGAFGWNVLSADHMPLAQRFSGMDGSKGDVRFDENDWHQLETGAPILKNALCSFDCKVINSFPVRTHTVFIGAVVAGTHRDELEALVYRQGKFATVRNI